MVTGGRAGGNTGTDGAQAPSLWQRPESKDGDLLLLYPADPGLYTAGLIHISLWLSYLYYFGCIRVPAPFTWNGSMGIGLDLYQWKKERHRHKAQARE